MLAACSLAEICLAPAITPRQEQHQLVAKSQYYVRASLTMWDEIIISPSYGLKASLMVPLLCILAPNALLLLVKPASRHCWYFHKTCLAVSPLSRRRHIQPMETLILLSSLPFKSTSQHPCHILWDLSEGSNTLILNLQMVTNEWINSENNFFFFFS